MTVSTISVRDRIIDAWIAGLKTITKANGYYNNVANVFDPPIGIMEMNQYPSCNMLYDDETCMNSEVGMHLQTGGNNAILQNRFAIKMLWFLSENNAPRKAQNMMLADVQKFFGYHWNVPDENGNTTAWTTIYAGSALMGIQDEVPQTGLEIRYNVWYRQQLVNPNLTQ
jgi:hypothetical protein